MGIPIPYGTDYSLELTGSLMKPCRCEACDEEYLYQVERSSTGKGTSLLWLDNQGAKERAAASARQQLQAELEKAVDPVHCPSCGWLQSGMVAQLKNRRLYRGIAVGAVVGGLLFVWGLLFAGDADSTALMASGGVIFVLGLSGGALLRHVCDPNAGHAERGRQLAAESRGILKATYEADQEARYKEFAQRFRATLKQVMASMIVADGDIADAEVEVVSSVYEKVTGLPLADDEVRTAAEEAVGKWEVAVAGVRALAPDLIDEAKALFVKACLLVAGADGHLDDEEWGLLVQVAGAAGLDSEEFQSILNELTAPDEAASAEA